MQQQPYYYAQAQGYNQDGGPAHQQWLQDNNKPNQYHQWDNGGFNVTSSGNYGPGQVHIQASAQNRVQVGPQQPQQPSQPPPVSTPPNIHGDMNKQSVMQNQQQAQMNFIATRPAMNQAFAFARGMPQQPRLQPHNRPQIVTNSYIPIIGPQQQVLTQSSAPATIVQYPPGALMYGAQQRAGTPYPNQPGGYLIQQNPYFNPQMSMYQPLQLPAQQYQNMTSGGPSPQGTTQQPSMSIMRPINPTQSAPAAPTMKLEPKKRTHAIKIIDPDTNQEVAVGNDLGGDNNNITPTRSNDSSARETPQPNAGIAIDNTLAAEFAARVAAKAIESEPPAQPPTEPVQDIPSESEIHHKQLPVVPSSEKVVSIVLSTSSEEFIPRSHKPAQVCEPPIEESRTPYVPTVSAETNSPVVEIQRPKEQFPALKNAVMPSATITQSPMRVNSKKQKSGENERQQVTSAPVPVNITQAPPTPVDSQDNLNNKKGPKSSSKEDVSVTKERRDKPRTVIKEQSPAPSPVASPDSASSPDFSAVLTTKPSPLPTATFGKDGGRISVVTPSASVEEPIVKVQQHQNGESSVPDPTVVFDGSKTAKQKNKKPSKMRDLNRKGVEKEGSDMDAFMSETSIVNDNRPPTPESPPPPATKLPSTSPPLSLEPHSPVDKIKEDLEEKEDKLVAAKNEENAKVSALTQAQEPAPVIVSEKPAPAQLTLKHSYKKDQWSPINPEGKKKYERDFLMELKSDSQSQHKPDNLPDIVAVLRDTSNNMRNQSMNFMNRGDLGGIIPSFMQRSSQSQRGPLPKPRSQQGMKGKGQGPKVIHVSLSLHEDVKLKTAENAWKPTRLVHDGEKPEQDKQTEELYKNVRGVLNKLTPQKFDTLMRKFMAFPINSEERLIGVINLIFEKAVDEPSFSKAYANMCKLCSKLEVSKLENGVEQKVNFRKILITRCQTEFESNKPDLLEGDKRLEEIKNCADPEQKKELQAAYDEKERQIRMKSVGNIRFIGELFKLGMLTPAIMYRCIEHLLNTPEEESLECLCKLLTTIGRDLEYGQQQHPKATPVPLQPYFKRMQDLASKKGDSKVSSRVRFMLQDVLDLRANKWVPRREDNNPKTIDQITKEAERESIEMTIALSQQPQRMNRQNERQDDRKRGNRGGGGGNQQNEDGWNTVSSNNRHYNKFSQSFDTSKIQNIVKPEMDLNSVSLGGSQQFRFSSAPKTMDNKHGSFTSSNAFSALQSRGDERKPPPQPNMNNNRRITPTPSIEKDKERQRMIQGVENSGDGRSSRGSSAQRERPQPPSRESSQPRHAPADNKEALEAKPQERNTKIVDEEAARQAMEKLERQTNTIFDEYLGNFTTEDDARQEIEQLYPGDKIGDFVQKALTMSLEKKAGTQKRIGVLLTTLMEYKLFSADVIVEQLGIMYEVIDDFAIDVPKVWELQAQVIVPVLAAERMNFSHFKSACSSVLKTDTASKLLVPVLNLAVQEKGAGFVRKVWDSSNVNLKDFLPSEVNIDAFIKANSLEYLTGEAPKCDSSSNPISMEHVQTKLLRLMQQNRPYDEILDYINRDVGSKVEDLHFIRALITAICEACITSSSNNYSLDKVKFKQCEKLIQRFVDNKENRELACLSAVHILVCRLEHPSGLIKNIFNLFLDNNLISCESFLKWNNDDQEKLENKGVSTMSLTSFFAALEEGETDEENS